MPVQLVASLVGEIVLACKEVNQKTRAAANDMLVDVAHAMHESAPPSLDPSTLHAASSSPPSVSKLHLGLTSLSAAWCMCDALLLILLTW